MVAIRLFVVVLFACVWVSQAQLNFELQLVKKLANECCDHGCSPQNFSLFERYIAEQDLSKHRIGSPSYIALEYAKKVIEGSVPCVNIGGTSKRAELNHDTRGAPNIKNLNISCPSGPYDVAAQGFVLTCSVSVFISNDTLNYVEFYVIGPQGQTQYSPLVFGAGISVYNGPISIGLPRYAANGTWNVFAYSYTRAYTTRIDQTTVPSFQILSTVNDFTPPVVKVLSVTQWTLNPCSLSNTITFNVSDDLSGITQLTFDGFDTNYVVGFSFTVDTPIKGSRVYTAIPNIATTPIQLGATYRFLAIAQDAAWNQLYQDSTSGLTVTANVTTGKCRAGQYAPNAAAACSDCPAGKFSNNGSFSCCACPAGTVAAGPGAAACLPCPSGYYSVGGSAQCVKCPSGTLSLYAGSAVCSPCEFGYSSSPGAIGCTQCPIGYTACPGDATCTACPKGTYSSDIDYNKCKKCSPGYFSSTAGASSCDPCPVNTYSASVGAVSCTACASGKKGPLASNSIMNCA